ncbi:MAG: hypothetical protein AAGI54_01825 [Planctomycetota bacterium]
MSKLSDLKLKRQAIAEWWAVRRLKRVSIEPTFARNIAIVLAVVVLVLILAIQAWGIFRLAVQTLVGSYVM